MPFTQLLDQIASTCNCQSQEEGRSFQEAESQTGFDFNETDKWKWTWSSIGKVSEELYDPEYTIETWFWTNLRSVELDMRDAGRVMRNGYCCPLGVGWDMGD